MDKNVKYYTITLRNLFLNDSGKDIQFGVYENNKYYDLLTKKEIYMVNSEDEFSEEDFINSNCKLIGIKKEEVDGSKISLFLRFMTQSGKENLISQVNMMERAIQSSINSYKLQSNNKVKKMKKEDFLKKF